MRKIPKLLLGICALWMLPLLSTAQNFEGIIYYQIPEMSAQGMGEMPYMIKDDKVRMEFGAGMEKGAMLLLAKESKMTFILDSMKGFITMDMDKKYDDMKSVDLENKPDVTKTGNMKTIAGKSCEVWKIKTEDGLMETCMAKGMGNFMMPQSPMAQRNTPQWAKEIMAGGAMPLEVIELKGNKQTVQMRATRIEEKSLGSELFTIPRGYNDMSGMMKQMMNRNRN